MSSPVSDIDVAANLAAVKSAIETARHEAGLEGPPPTIVAVTKRQPEARIRAALEAGHRVFGENRVEEAAARWPGLREAYRDVELHLVGQLQGRKAEDAVRLFDVIQTLDRARLARRLAAAMEKIGRCPSLFVQVNTGEEPQKGGVAPGELEALLTLARGELGLPVEGLMCLPPVDDEPALHFALLAKLARRHGLARLSMGMSGDYEIAAAMGADLVRVGTGIFGPREAGR